MADITLWHNPRCSKSRGTLQLLQERGIEATIRDYQATPPSVDELRDLLKRLGITSHGLVRSSETEYAELGLGPNASDDVLLEAMATHPRLIQRPILVVGDKAVIGRPPERILELLD